MSATPTEPPQRRLLVLSTPPAGKLPSDMSDNERRAWAKEIVGKMAVAHRIGRWNH